MQGQKKNRMWKAFAWHMHMTSPRIIYRRYRKLQRRIPGNHEEVQNGIREIVHSKVCMLNVLSHCFRNSTNSLN